MSSVCMLCLESVENENRIVRFCHSRPEKSECKATVLCCVCIARMYERNGDAPQNMCMVCTKSCRGPDINQLKREITTNTHVSFLRSNGLVGTDMALKSTARLACMGVEKMRITVRRALQTNKKLKREWIKLSKFNFKAITECGKARSVRPSTINTRHNRCRKYNIAVQEAINNVNYQLQVSKVAFRL